MMKYSLLWKSLFIFLIIRFTYSSAALATCEFPAIYNFGDSNSDTGGMAAAFYPMGSPCGETYFHRPAGRGSDGRLIIDFIGQEAIDKSRLPIPEEFTKALYIMDIGQNDIAAAFRKLSSMEQVKATLPDIINHFASQVRDLYKKGARNFWIHNTGPIGCLPVATVKVKDPSPGYLDEQGCIKDQNDIALEFNKQLLDVVIQLRNDLQEVSIIYVDLYKAKYELISNAKNQGFEESFKICCGYHDNENDVWCGRKERIKNGTEIYAGSCNNPSNVISWDGVHYTEAANHWITNNIINGYFSNPPIPITKACQSLL